MNHSQPESDGRNEGRQLPNTDEIILVTGPGDTTVRPSRPEIKAFLPTAEELERLKTQRLTEEIIIDDSLGDTTVRPARPELRRGPPPRPHRPDAPSSNSPGAE